PATSSVVEDDEETVPDKEVAALLDREVRTNLRDVKSGLQWILGVLGGRGRDAGEIRMTPARDRATSRRPTGAGRGAKSRSRKAVRLSRPRPAKAARPARSAKKSAG